MNELEKKLAEMEATIKSLQETIAAFKIDKQLMIKRERMIKAGVACKVVYNADGLIVDAQPLTSADIPDIPISKVESLREELNKKASSEQITSMNDKIDNVMKPGPVDKTGTKFNVDGKGLVIDVVPLLPDDIPTLPISKIDGLSDTLESIKSTPTPTQQEFKTEPGVGVKVEYDNQGRIIKTHPLTLDDIPGILITRLNEIESTLLTKVDTNSLSDLTKIIEQLSRIPQFHTGSYTKFDVTQDSILPSKLDASDIPILPIDKVQSLVDILATKADHATLMELQNTVSTIVSRLTTINELNQLTRTLETKSDQHQVESLKREISDIKSSISRLSNSDPLYDQLTKINSRISELSSRIAQLELSNRLK